MASRERASQEEQNGTKFSFITPSSEELRVLIVASLQMYTHGKGRHHSGFQMLITPHWKVLRS